MKVNYLGGYTRLFMLIMAALTVGCNPLADNDASDPEIPKASMTVSAISADGSINPANLWSGQWRVVSIWAEWCKPCWQEIPELNQFNSLQKESNIKLLGFNFDELEAADLALISQKMAIKFPVLTQWPAQWAVPEIPGLPATIIISPDDDIDQILLGPQTVESLQAALVQAK